MEDRGDPILEHPTIDPTSGGTGSASVRSGRDINGARAAQVKHPEHPLTDPANSASVASSPDAATEPPPPSPAPESAPAVFNNSGAYVTTEEWTWRLLDRGFTAAEAAAIRGLEPKAIERHALWVARKGKPIPMGAFLAAEVQGRWDAWADANGDGPPPSEPGASPSLWELFLAARSAVR